VADTGSAGGRAIVSAVLGWVISITTHSTNDRLWHVAAITVWLRSSPLLTQSGHSVCGNRPARLCSIEGVRASSLAPQLRQPFSGNEVKWQTFRPGIGRIVHMGGNSGTARRGVFLGAFEIYAIRRSVSALAAW
jgi:hypothetical protein